jgi:hypothetical protein
MDGLEARGLRLTEVKVSEPPPHPDRHGGKAPASDTADVTHQPSDGDTGYPVGKQEVQVFLCAQPSQP